MNGPATRKLLRFSVFEIDLDSGELFKKGQKLKLQGQPFELLIELLNNTGSVVTREQLKERLWPGDTAGDFDSSLNRAINRNQGSAWGTCQLSLYLVLALFWCNQAESGGAIVKKPRQLIEC